MCPGNFALCTSAKCYKTKNNKLICYCNVIKNSYGVSLNTPCSQVSQKGNIIYSLYSGINDSKINSNTCNSGKWGNCLNKVCILDKKNPNKAFCFCPSKQHAPWNTATLKVSKKPCSCNNLSGMYPKISKAIIPYYIKNIKQTIIKYNMRNINKKIFKKIKTRYLYV
jgi:hypothetical protein